MLGGDQPPFIAHEARDVRVPRDAQGNRGQVVLGRLLLLLIAAYQRLLSPLLGPSCRFEPSCSHYAADCIRDHGPLRGSWLALRRLGRCHPFHPGGFDPPPPALTRNGHGNQSS